MPPKLNWPFIKPQKSDTELLTYRREAVSVLWLRRAPDEVSRWVRRAAAERDAAGSADPTPRRGPRARADGWGQPSQRERGVGRRGRSPCTGAGGYLGGTAEEGPP